MDKKVVRTKEKYGNFVYGKVYTATPRHKRKVEGGGWIDSSFEITDEDGDVYTVTNHKGDLKVGWEWLDQLNK